MKSLKILVFTIVLTLLNLYAFNMNNVYAEDDDGKSIIETACGALDSNCYFGSDNECFSGTADAVIVEGTITCYWVSQ